MSLLLKVNTVTRFVHSNVHKACRSRARQGFGWCSHQTSEWSQISVTINSVWLCQIGWFEYSRSCRSPGIVLDPKRPAGEKINSTGLFLVFNCAVWDGWGESDLPRIPVFGWQKWNLKWSSAVVAQPPHGSMCRKLLYPWTVTHRTQVFFFYRIILCKH